MNNDAILAAIEARAEQAEAAAFASEIQLVLTRARIAELEAAVAAARDAQAARAVKALAAHGAIGGDVFTHHELKQQFITDPELIPLALGRVFNQRANKQSEQKL
jgi:multidrug efflux pump subunit AcrA (membrane-fusion protein)